MSAFGSVSASDTLGSLDSKTLCKMYLAKGEKTYLDEAIERELRSRPSPAPVCTLITFMKLVISGEVTVESLFEADRQ